MQTHTVVEARAKLATMLVEMKSTDRVNSAAVIASNVVALGNAARSEDGIRRALGMACRRLGFTLSGTEEAAAVGKTVDMLEKQQMLAV